MVGGGLPEDVPELSELSRPVLCDTEDAVLPEDAFEMVEEFGILRAA